MSKIALKYLLIFPLFLTLFTQLVCANTTAIVGGTVVDLDGKSVEDTVAKWMSDNKSTWQAWIK